MKLNSIIFCLCAGLCSSAVINDAFSMDKLVVANRGQLNNYSLFIASRYLESSNDHANLVLSSKRFQHNMTKFHYNPIHLNVNNNGWFPKIETLVLKHDDNVDDFLNHLISSDSIANWNDHLEDANHVYLDAAKNIIDYLNGKDADALAFRAFLERNNIAMISEKELSGLADHKIERRILELSDLYYMFNEYGKKFEEYLQANNNGLYRDVYKAFLRDEYFIILQHQPRSFVELLNGTNKANLHRMRYNHNTGTYDVNEFVKCDGMGVEEVPAYEVTRRDISQLKRQGADIVGIVNNYLTHVKSIAKHAFFRINELTDVVIPGNIESIESGAFAQCDGIRTLQLNEGLKSIGYAAFERLAIETINIPRSVENIGRAAFTNCAQLREVIIPSNVTDIRQETFYKCTSLKNVTIEDGVEKIGYQAFAGCTTLEHIEIPGSVNTIDMSAFSDCTGLKSAVIHDGVEVIGHRMFEGCTSLQNVVLPQGLQKIGARAFADTALTEIEIPDSVEEIDGNAFEGCTGLTSVTIPEGVTSISCFAECTGLTEIELPNSVTEIGYYAFQGCTNLESISISSNIQEVEEYAFDGCDNLNAVNVRCDRGISDERKQDILDMLENGGVERSKVKFIEANGGNI